MLDQSYYKNTSDDFEQITIPEIYEYLSMISSGFSNEATVRRSIKFLRYFNLINRSSPFLIHALIMDVKSLPKDQVIGKIIYELVFFDLLDRSKIDINLKDFYV